MCVSSMAETTTAAGQLVDFGLGPYVHGTPSRRFPVYTRGNAGEVYPQPVFPLTSAMGRALAGAPAERSAGPACL